MIKEFTNLIHKNSSCLTGSTPSFSMFYILFVELYLLENIAQARDMKKTFFFFLFVFILSSVEWQIDDERKWGGEGDGRKI